MYRNEQLLYSTIMTNISIRKLSSEDVYTLQNIGRQTFYETFAGNNSEEDMQKYLEESFATKKLETELNNVNSAFYFAQIENNVVGYLKINFGTFQTEIQDQNTLEIERIYVLKEFHGQKIGQVLFEKAIEIAKAENVDYVWLGVWEENHRAMSFYQKNGFTAFDKHIFKLGNQEQTDIMMRLLL